MGNADETMEILKTSNKGMKMNCWESLFTHTSQQQDTLIEEQRSTTLTPFTSWLTPQDNQNTLHNSTSRDSSVLIILEHRQLRTYGSHHIQHNLNSLLSYH
jgi:hypothetical protein